MRFALPDVIAAFTIVIVCAASIALGVASSQSNHPTAGLADRGEAKRIGAMPADQQDADLALKVALKGDNARE